MSHAGHHMFHIHAAAAAKSHQSCLTLCDPIDGSPPGYPVPGILQARTLEWVAIFEFYLLVHDSKHKRLATNHLLKPLDLIISKFSIITN